MRSAVAAYCVLASLIGLGTPAAAECPAGALGTSRTIVVDPTEHVRLGGFQYRESLPLQDKEVVLTFDDGPLPPYTNRILDTLASECVKATFFMVGRMVHAYPQLVRRIYNEGHTVANHSQNHPFTFHRMPVDRAAQEIEDGFTSLKTVLGDQQAVAPFFRIPGLLRQDSVEQYLASRGYMTWSVDFMADDWTRISAAEVARRAIDRMESRGRGIMLLHDIQPATALALPAILRELKARGFKIVHVVPATADRPKTVTEPQQWAVRGPSSQPQHWPRVVTVGLESPEPVLAAPNPASFGVADAREGRVKVALMGSFERRPTLEGELRPAPAASWPPQMRYSVPEEADILPVPGAQNFRYSKVFRLGPEKRNVVAAARKPTAVPITGTNPTRMHDFSSTARLEGMPSGPRPPRPIGHQFSVVRPPFSLSPPFGVR